MDGKSNPQIKPLPKNFPPEHLINCYVKVFEILKSLKNPENLIDLKSIENFRTKFSYYETNDKNTIPKTYKTSELRFAIADNKWNGEREAVITTNLETTLFHLQDNSELLPHLETAWITETRTNIDEFIEDIKIHIPELAKALGYCPKEINDT